MHLVNTILVQCTLATADYNGGDDVIDNGGGSDDGDSGRSGGRSSARGDGDDDDDDVYGDDVKQHVKQLMFSSFFSCTKYHRHLHGTQLHYSWRCELISLDDVHGIQGRNRKDSK